MKALLKNKWILTFKNVKEIGTWTVKEKNKDGHPIRNCKIQCFGVGTRIIQKSNCSCIINNYINLA